MATPLDQLEPVAAGGAVAMPIDWQTISLVWDEHGYPADPVIPRLPRADGERDARVDATAASPTTTTRRPPARASTLRDFVDRVIARADAYRAARGRPALVVCALDTELLGHWWYEGPRWLEEVIAQAGAARPAR